MQTHRMMDLFDSAEISESPEEFIGKRFRRSPSSIEEELVSRLPLFDQEEQNQILSEASKIISPMCLSFPDMKAFEAVSKANPELGKKLRSIGLSNFQHLMQLDFYKSAARILEETKSEEFKAEYQKVTPINFNGINATCIEQYGYNGSTSYRSMFYMLLRHLTNVEGGESELEIRAKAKSAFSRRKILELGSGPGFFLRLLQNFGAEVKGVDINSSLEKEVRKRNLPVVFGDLKDLKKLVGDEKYDIIFSRDVISYAVTRDDSHPIMQSAFDVLRNGGLSIHQIDYKKASEEQYLGFVAKYAEKHKMDAEKVRKTFQMLPPEQKEIILRRNIFNISPQSLERIGYTPLTGFRLDAEDNLSLTLQKPLG